MDEAMLRANVALGALIRARDASECVEFRISAHFQLWQLDKIVTEEETHALRCCYLIYFHNNV